MPSIDAIAAAAAADIFSFFDAYATATALFDIPPAADGAADAILFISPLLPFSSPPLMPPLMLMLLYFCFAISYFFAFRLFLYFCLPAFLLLFYAITMLVIARLISSFSMPFAAAATLLSPPLSCHFAAFAAIAPLPLFDSAA